MKLLKITFAAVVALAFNNAYAFHSGGVAECSGCHSMHSASTGAAGAQLLKGSDPSSTCLGCHAHSGDTTQSSYHIASYIADAQGAGGGTPIQRTPGGDFAWSIMDLTYMVRTTPTTEFGYTRGHNIVAADLGFPVDPDNTVAPGGTYLQSNLSCISCHDPHGQYRRLADDTVTKGGLTITNSGSYPVQANKYLAPVANTTAVGSYRILAGAGYSQPDYTVPSYPGVPVAVAPATYNQNESTATTQIRVAYANGLSGKSGNTTWGQWCGTCHPAMYNPGTAATAHKHPVDVGLGSYAANYNNYVSTGNLTGSSTTSFNGLVPFAKGISVTTYAGLAVYASGAGVNPATNLEGAASDDQVTCMSCHRAHASGFPEMLRWFGESEFILDNLSTTPAWPGTTGATGTTLSNGRTAAMWSASYNGRTPAMVGSQAQRQLCNKCHLKD